MKYGKERDQFKATLIKDIVFVTVFIISMSYLSYLSVSQGVI